MLLCAAFEACTQNKNPFPRAHTRVFRCVTHDAMAIIIFVLSTRLLLLLLFLRCLLLLPPFGPCNQKCVFVVVLLKRLRADEISRYKNVQTILLPPPCVTIIEPVSVSSAASRLLKMYPISRIYIHVPAVANAVKKVTILHSTAILNNSQRFTIPKARLSRCPSAEIPWPKSLQPKPYK